ncbi:hypothetical protein CCYA_CCYA19G4737 [Cyanidiococcus yangmingshanensis]|nr:hypothetical protein CCYA_CCYA19G4737 [Cyanidiococcus yangmingshanensis]
MHETTALLRAWQDRLLAWEAEEPNGASAVDPTRAAAYRQLCKVFFDAARSQGPGRSGRTDVRLSLGQLAQLALEGFDLEQVWAELEIRNRSLYRSVTRALKRLERSLFQEDGGPFEGDHVEGAGANGGGAVKRVRFAEERNETREFARDEDEQVGCMSPNFFLDDDDDDDDEADLMSSSDDDRGERYARAWWSNSESSEFSCELSFDSMHRETSIEEASSESETSADGNDGATALREASSMAAQPVSTQSGALSETVASVSDAFEKSPGDGSTQSAPQGGPRVRHDEDADLRLDSDGTACAGPVRFPHQPGELHDSRRRSSVNSDPSVDVARDQVAQNTTSEARSASETDVLQLEPTASDDETGQVLDESSDEWSAGGSSPTLDSDENEAASSDSSVLESDTADSAASAEDAVYYADFFETHSPRNQGKYEHSHSGTKSGLKSFNRSRHRAEDSVPGSLKLAKNSDTAQRSETSDGPDADTTTMGTKRATSIPETAFERCEALMRARARSIESFHIEEKPWQLRGEVAAAERPLDSVLDAELDFDLSTARRPRVRTQAYEVAITGGEIDETLSELSSDSDDGGDGLSEAAVQARILQRVTDQVYDDVPRRIRPSAEMLRASVSAHGAEADVALDRPQQSLAQLYAQRDTKTEGLAAVAPGKATNQGRDSATITPLEQVDKLFDELSAQIETQTQLALRPFTETDEWSLRPQRLESQATHTVAMEEPAPLFLRYENRTAPGDTSHELESLRDRAARLPLDTDTGISVRLKHGDMETSRSSRRTRRNRLKRLLRVRRRQQHSVQEQRQQAAEWLQQSALRDAIASCEAKSKSRSRHESRIAGESERDQEKVFEQAVRVVNQVEAQAQARAQLQVDRGYHAGIRIRKAEHYGPRPDAGTSNAITSALSSSRQRSRRLEAGDDHVQAGGGSGSSALYRQLQRQLQDELQRQRAASSPEARHSDGKGYRRSV